MTSDVDFSPAWVYQISTITVKRTYGSADWNPDRRAHVAGRNHLVGVGRDGPTGMSAYADTTYEELLGLQHDISPRAEAGLVAQGGG